MWSSLKRFLNRLRQWPLAARIALSALVLLALISLLAGVLRAPAQLYGPVYHFAPFFAGDAQAVGWSGDGQYLAGGFINPEVHIWAIADGHEVGRISDFNGGIRAVA